MRIAMLSRADSKRPFGSFTRPVWLGEELASMGHEVTHFCPEPPHLVRSDVHYRRYALPSDIRGVVVSGGSVVNLLSLSQLRADILYIHELANTGFVAARVLHLLPIVLDAHSSEAMELRSYGKRDRADKAHLAETMSLHFADMIIAASHELRDYLISEYGLPPERCHVVQNGVPARAVTDPPCGTGWREKLRLASDELLVLHAAPDQFESNDLSLDFMEECAKAASSKRLSLRMLVCGRNDAPVGIQAIGVVDDYYGLVDACDIALLPYPPRAVCGGARNKSLEFMARSKAIVSTKEGVRGIPDAISGTHYLRADSPEEVVTSIESLAANPELRRNLGVSARQLAGRYTWSQSARALERVFHEV